MIISGEKYACLSCIRGHRTGRCNHQGRQLLKVRKRGRPAGDFKVMVVPVQGSDSNCTSGQQSQDELDEEKSAENEPLVYTDKYIFVHVGRGLYRKVRRSAYASVQGPLGLCPNGGESEQEFHRHLAGGADPLSNNTECCHSASLDTTATLETTAALERAAHRQECHSHLPPPYESAEYESQGGLSANRAHAQDVIAESGSRQSKHAQRPPVEGLPTKNLIAMQNPDPGCGRRHEFVHRDPTLMVMSPPRKMECPTQKYGRSLTDLGFAPAEAQRLQMELSDVNFAPLCMFPNQCECGESCECEGCYTHSKQRASL